MVAAVVVAVVNSNPIMSSNHCFILAEKLTGHDINPAH